ncbi:MAG: dGTPase [Gammaproteobacteria bacterium]|nr:dGTPase [Gammaproteobacteria bacterium]MBU0818344.1 dGTPase [Gammaproteobacteria bacterium]MBU0843787.1 dGTPase [Gammaproteobacteria bacterium]MBU1840682.1 dGTPase [Gammaproteobacteria bacterium]
MASIYKELLSIKRFRASAVGDRSTLLEAESDRGRLLFCPAFRRLQQKAQVFSLESNAAVRSRLTHSLEVSQMGRYIADQVSLQLIEKEWATPLECAALTTFVETACLMHDIGNPPFGHFGESAISQWFREKGRDSILKSFSSPDFSLSEQESVKIANALADFSEFDGNPQGIRVVTKLQRNADEYGLNLTITTIASYLKYVRASGDSDKIFAPFTKKCGYFSTEADLVHEVWAGLEYKSPQRFPLAYIMEAADDIAYCISDLEDSIEKGLLEKEKALADIYKAWMEKGPYDDEVSASINTVLADAVRGRRDNGSIFTYTDFRTSLNRYLVVFSAAQYIQCHSEILRGTCLSLIPANSSAGKILQTLKDYCREKVYRHESVQMVELAGYRAIYGLLDQFKCLLEASESRFVSSLKYENKDSAGKPIIVENKLLSILPKNYKAVYEEHRAKLDPQSNNYKFLEWNLRAHLITDFISGMTDDFAIKTYQVLNGIKL